MKELVRNWAKNLSLNKRPLKTFTKDIQNPRQVGMLHIQFELYYTIMWKCQTCSYSNDIALTNCDLCDATQHATQHSTETATNTNTDTTNTDTTNKDEEEDKLSVNSSDDETDGQQPEVREEEVGGIVREKDTLTTIRES